MDAVPNPGTAPAPPTSADAAIPHSQTTGAVLRCIRCSYALTGLGTLGTCPECGAKFDLADPRTFTRREPFMAWKFWMPGLAMAAGIGIALQAAIVYLMGSWGWTLWLVLPACAGAVLGYRFRLAGILGFVVLVLCGLGVLLGIILGMMAMNLGGIFCGLMLAGIAVLPVVVGCSLGALLRTGLKSTSFSQRSYLPLIGFVVIPLASALIEGRPPQHAPETIVTRATINASPDAAWRGIVFYEEVDHEPPLLLRIGLAHPLRTVGRSSSPGDIKTCAYNKGHLTKRVTAAEPGKRLAFEVIEQQIGYERDVRLISGSFEFTPNADGTTLVTLSTTYEPLLTPRFCWRWGEAYAVHLLHGHVLEGIRRRAERERESTVSLGEEHASKAGPSDSRWGSTLSASDRSGIMQVTLARFATIKRY